MTELALPPTCTTEIADLRALDRPITADELLRLPEGPPYSELIHGELYVNPPPSVPHQRVLLNLAVLLREAGPPDLETFIAPTGWQVDSHSLVEPDLLVVRRPDQGARVITGTPLLCIEVLSPSNRRYDTVRKRQLYEASGVTSYWIVDLATDGLTSLLALELRDGRYVTVHHGVHRFDAELPFPVTIDPERLAV